MQDWVKNLFGSLTPSQDLIHRDMKIFNDKEDWGCIINSPESTMTNPILGTDTTSMIQKVKECAAISPGDHTKPLLVCVRGTGGGKTRLFEELRRNLYLEPDVLPIAITFNGDTSYDGIEYLMNKNEKDLQNDKAKKHAAMSIIARIARVFYGMKLFGVQRLIRNQLKSLTNDFDTIELYTSFIKLMRDQLAAAGRNTTTFVLFMDETVHFQRFLCNEFGENIDPLSPLRSSLLDKSLNSTLALSSLSVYIPGVSAISHPILTLSPQEMLNPADIVENWWTVLQGSDPHTKQRFMIIAALLCNLPRGAEDFYDELLQDRTELGKAKYTTDIIQTLIKTASQRYVGFQLPSPERLYCLWFNKSIELTVAADFEIQSSLLTNVPTCNEILNASDPTTMAYFTPRTNLLLLSKCPLLNERFYKHFQDVLSKILHCAVPVQEGEVDRRLVDITALVLHMRIMVAKYSDKCINAAELLGLRDCSDIPALYCNIPLTTDIEYNNEEQLPVLKYNSNYNNSKAKALQELRDIEVDEFAPVALYRSANGDSYDMVLKVHNPSLWRSCHYVFVNCQSEEEKERRIKRDNQRFPKGDSEAQKITELMRGESIAYVYQTLCDIEHTELHNTVRRPKLFWGIVRKLYRSLQRRWWYWLSARRHCEGVTVLAGRSEAQRFFGPVWEFYKALRGSDSAGRAL